MASSAGNSKILKCSQEYDDHVPETTVHSYMFERMKQYSDKVAFVDIVTKRQWKFSELSDAAQKLAAGLQAQEGLVKGQFVAFALPNCMEFVVSLLAVSQCGGVASFVNPIYGSRELDHVVSIIKPDLWICMPEFLPRLEILGKSGYSTRAVIVDLKTDSSPWHSLMSSGIPENCKQPSFNVFEDLATMPFSSGTTGLPKGVMLSHHNIITALCQFKVWCPFQDHDVNLAVLPFFHQYGCLMALTTLAVGARVINMAQFSFSEMLQAVQDYKVTMIPLVPPIALLLSKHPSVEKYDLSSLKGIISSAAPLSLDVIEVLIKKFECDVLQGYGMTECTLATHFTPRGQRRHSSVGVLMPFYEAKIVDQNTGEDMGVKGVGEICVRGRMVMKGYRGNPTSTAEIIKPDGWLHTGDIGYYDEDGWFYIVDRLKELIKYKGFQVPPSELEHLLLTHSEVVDAAVVGVPDEMAGELPRAYVVRRPDSSVTEQELCDFIESQVAPYKKLRGGVIFTDAIPKLASGKILRRQLRDLVVVSKL